jgi:hypothetical protein
MQKDTVIAMMKLVLKKMELDSFEYLKLYGWIKPVIPITWTRDAMVGIFFQLPEVVNSRKRWSVAAVKAAIPRFYGRIIIVDTKGFGKHHYTTAAFYEAAVDILIERNDEVRANHNELSQLRQDLAAANDELRDLRRLYNLRGQDGKTRVEYIKSVAAGLIQTANVIEEVIDCKHDFAFMRQLGISPKWSPEIPDGALFCQHVIKP